MTGWLEYRRQMTGWLEYRRRMTGWLEYRRQMTGWLDRESRGLKWQLVWMGELASWKVGWFPRMAESAKLAA